jgi:hypothetical protein
MKHIKEINFILEELEFELPKNELPKIQNKFVLNLKSV